MSTLPIEDYAFLSDSHTGALVSREGSVDWLCLPRFDSPAVFSRLLDEDAGHWSIRPVSREVQIQRRYLDGSLVLETTFTTPSGVMVLTDALAAGQHERGHDLGAEAPHTLLRRVQCTQGEVEVRTHFAPRPEYGLVHPLFRPVEGGWMGQGGASILRLSAQVAMEARDSTVTASFTLHALWVAACPDESHKFFDFIANTTLTRVRREGDLQIMFGIGGEHDLTEREVPHLRGWRNSRPVRIGNGAWNQRQLDVYGELLDAAWRFRDYLEGFDFLTRRLLADLADSAAARWGEKDRGIWEMRGEAQHFLHSKLMSWVARAWTPPAS